jgi:DNA-directed RNA polymerase subunit RPC12/RpoP
LVVKLRCAQTLGLRLQTIKVITKAEILVSQISKEVTTQSAYDTTIDQSMDTTVVGQTMDRAQDMVERPRKMLDSSYMSSNFNPLDLKKQAQNHERQIRFEQPVDLTSSDREKQRELTERREAEMVEAKKHVTYVCGDCFLDVKMQVTGLGSQKRSAVRCTHCGFRVLYKKRSQDIQSVYDCR